MIPIAFPVLQMMDNSGLTLSYFLNHVGIEPMTPVKSIFRCKGESLPPTLRLHHPPHQILPLQFFGDFQIDILISKETFEIDWEE